MQKSSEDKYRANIVTTAQEIDKYAINNQLSVKPITKIAYDKPIVENKT